MLSEPRCIIRIIGVYYRGIRVDNTENKKYAEAK